MLSLSASAGSLSNSNSRSMAVRALTTEGIRRERSNTDAGLFLPIAKGGHRSEGDTACAEVNGSPKKSREVSAGKGKGH